MLTLILCIEAVPDLMLSLCKRFDVEEYLYDKTGM